MSSSEKSLPLTIVLLSTMPMVSEVAAPEFQVLAKLSQRPVVEETPNVRIDAPLKKNSRVAGAAGNQAEIHSEKS
jgi:hypothetical protein